MEKRRENEKDWQFEGRIRHCSLEYFPLASSLSPLLIVWVNDLMMFSRERVI
jgi:hypothetical protein